MKKAATIIAIAGVAMASSIEAEDHSFHVPLRTGGILPTIRERHAVAHDDFADDNFAVEDLADESLFSLFGKKKKPQPQQQIQVKPTNPDDIVDIGDIRVDLNSNEFFSLKDLLHHKKKPQQQPQPSQPKEIPSNEFFAEEIGDDNFGLLSLFKKKKKPQQQQQPQGPVEIPSNEFFAEELGDDNFSILSSLFHKKKKHPHDPSEFQPREIPSNEFFAAEDIADDNFNGMLWFRSKKEQNEHKEKKHHHPEKPVHEKPVQEKEKQAHKPAQEKQTPKPVVDAPSNELFSLKDLFHRKKKPHQQPQQPQKPTNPDDIVDIGNIHVDLNSNEFFAEFEDNNFAVEELGDDNFSILSSLFHKKKKHPHDPSEFQPREIPSNEFFSLKDLFHHKKKPHQQPQQPQKPTNPDDIVDIGNIHVDLNSNEFFADDELVYIPSQMGPGRGSYNPTIKGAPLHQLGRLLSEAN